MPRKKSTRSTITSPRPEAIPANAKVCEHCGHINSFKRVKCEKCAGLLPEGNYERSKRLREQSLRRRQQQTALSASLFGESLLMTDESAGFDEPEARGKNNHAPPTDFERESDTDTELPEDGETSTASSEEVPVADDEEEEDL